MRVSATVLLRDPDTYEVVTVRAGEAVPGWATDLIGEHLVEDGDEGGYDSLKVDDLKAEIARRNEDREEADLISDEGKKADLVAALEADDNN